MTDKESCEKYFGLLSDAGQHHGQGDQESDHDNLIEFPIEC